jgi:hypothetical protein
MLQGAGEYREATFEDFLWAYSVFWSRAQSLPVPVRGGGGGGEGGGSAEGGGGGTEGAVRLEVVEGVVPGLDFANHSMQVGARGGGRMAQGDG